MMPVQQRAVPVIEEVLISDSEDDDVVIVDADETTKLQNKANKELTHTIDYENSPKNILYNNGDFEHLPQLFANRNRRKSEEMYFDEEYEISDASNSGNEAIIITNVNSSDKENVPARDSVRIESNERNADSDDDQFYIAEDCNTKDVINHTENNEEMDVDVDVVNLSNNHNDTKSNTNASSFKSEAKNIDMDKLKNDHADLGVNKLEIDQSAMNGKEAINNLDDVKLEPEELMLGTSSDDDSEDDQDEKIITIPKSQYGLKTRMKRFLRMFCQNCNVSKCVPKLYKPDITCKLCGSSLEFQCKTCLRCFENYSLGVIHLKQKCASNYFWHCPRCEYAVRTQSKLESHIDKAHANEPVPCPHCRKLMFNQKTLNKHISVSCIMTAPKFRCVNCDFKDRLLSKMKKHVLMSHSILEGGYKRIYRRKGLKDNSPKAVSEITNTTDLTAEPKVTEEKLDMERLIQLHCLKCKITFKKITNAGTKCKYCDSPLLYQCKMCKERIKSLCGIYDHLDNKCEFVICKKCNNRFKTKADAIEHHEACSKVMFKCRYCNYKTKQTHYLKKHETAKHNNENITAQK